jgi:hypothetical protein
VLYHCAQLVSASHNSSNLFKIKQKGISHLPFIKYGVATAVAASSLKLDGQHLLKMLSQVTYRHEHDRSLLSDCSLYLFYLLLQLDACTLLKQFYLLVKRIPAEILL